MLFDIRDEIDNPNEDDSINQLETLARRGYFSVPKYEYKESYDKNGNSVWNVRCRIKEIERSINSACSSKKKTKKRVAYRMLMYVLENY